MATRTKNTPTSAKKQPKEMEAARVDRVLGFSKTSSKLQSLLSEHVCALFCLYGVTGVKSELMMDFMYDIMFLDKVTKPHFRQFQHHWPHRHSKGGEHLEFWSAFRLWIRDVIDKMRLQNHQFFSLYPQDDESDAEDIEPDDEGIPHWPLKCWPPEQGSVLPAKPVCIRATMGTAFEGPSTLCKVAVDSVFCYCIINPKKVADHSWFPKVSDDFEPYLDEESWFIGVHKERLTMSHLF